MLCSGSPSRIISVTALDARSLRRNLDDLNRGLLSLINAALPLGFAAPLADEASQLRVDLADLYFFLYTYVEKMQNAWFNHEDFNQFTKDPSENLVLHHPSDGARLERFAGHVDRVSRALQKLDEVLVFLCESFLIDHGPVSLQPPFSRMLSRYFNHCLDVS